MRSHEVGIAKAFTPIFVRTHLRTYALQIGTDTDVQCLQTLIALATGLPVKEQVLTFLGRRLQSGHPLPDIKRDSTINVSCRLLGGQQTIKVTVKPRLQKDKWSLYWKESMCTKTECPEAIEIEVDASSSMSELTREVARQLGWQPVESLERLEGFTEPWEFAVFNGRALNVDESLAKNDITSDVTITIVRRMLIPEAWKNLTDMTQADDDESSSSDSEDWEQKF